MPEGAPGPIFASFFSFYKSSKCTATPGLGIAETKLAYSLPLYINVPVGRAPALEDRLAVHPNRWLRVCSTRLFGQFASNFTPASCEHTLRPVSHSLYILHNTTCAVEFIPAPRPRWPALPSSSFSPFSSFCLLSSSCLSETSLAAFQGPPDQTWQWRSMMAALPSR